MKSKFKSILIVLCFFTTLFPINTIAQAGKLPPFRIMKTNNHIFKAEDLPLEKPIVIIYFSPECDDCLTFMNDFFLKINYFKKSSIVMISYLPIHDMIQFEKKFNVKNYRNLTIGTEGSSFFLKDYYKLEKMPFLALYDKNGNLQCSFQRNIPLNTIIKDLTSLK